MPPPNAPAVLASAIWSRLRRRVAFADPIDVVVHQNDCQDGSDMRFEVDRQSRKRNK